MKHKKYKIGIIGMGGMGFRFLKSFLASPRWEVAAICDLNETRLAAAKELAPEALLTRKSADLMTDPEIDAVGIYTLADIRPKLLRDALRAGKHVVAEKPIADSIPAERELLEDIEKSDRIVAVNMFNRNAWYHEEILSFIRQGQIGETAIVSIRHQTPGLMPTEGHGPEGPPFHDCGMHYVDVARWYAGSEYGKWHSQGVRMWDWRDPWWINVHGTFQNGIVFNITQGFVYGQLAQTGINNCGIEVIGTKGVVKMQHNFRTATIDFHGVSHTETKTGPYGDKKTDVMCERFAQALDTGDASLLPSARDSVIASEVSQAMLDAASAPGVSPSIGSAKEMEEILEHRRALKAKAAPR